MTASQLPLSLLLVTGLSAAALAQYPAVTATDHPTTPPTVVIATNIPPASTTSAIVIGYMSVSDDLNQHWPKYVSNVQPYMQAHATSSNAWGSAVFNGLNHAITSFDVENGGAHTMPPEVASEALNEVIAATKNGYQHFGNFAKNWGEWPTSSWGSGGNAGPTFNWANLGTDNVFDFEVLARESVVRQAARAGTSLTRTSEECEALISIARKGNTALFYNYAVIEISEPDTNVPPPQYKPTIKISKTKQVSIPYPGQTGTGFYFYYWSFGPRIIPAVEGMDVYVQLDEVPLAGDLFAVLPTPSGLTSVPAWPISFMESHGVAFNQPVGCTSDFAGIVDEFGGLLPATQSTGSGQTFFLMVISQLVY